jgi:LmbE family N-acetylglucosaminyl deacetylase
MNILVIAPHPDDESIGCGGAICLHVKRGDRVSAVFLTSGELGLNQFPKEKAWAVREAEATNAAEVLGLAELTFLRKPDWYLGDHIKEAAAALKPILHAATPDLIYLPHEREWHPDHKAAAPIVRAALGRTAVSLRGYEIWSPITQYDHYENISSVMTRKLRAVRCHRSQMKEFPYDRAISGLNQYRGVIAAKAKFAEAFQTVSRQKPGK